MPNRLRGKRVKSLLKNEVKTSKETYTPTIDDCHKWFDILNEDMFNNDLPRIPFDFKWLRVCWAYYEYFPREQDRTQRIVMHKRYPSKRLFVECLAHEMVHHWQYVKLGPNKVDHNEEFFNWCKYSKSYGLRISEEQAE
jgi:hypothetical protein